MGLDQDQALVFGPKKLRKLLRFFAGCRVALVCCCARQRPAPHERRCQRAERRLGCRGPRRPAGRGTAPARTVAITVPTHRFAPAKKDACPSRCAALTWVQCMSWPGRPQGLGEVNPPQWASFGGGVSPPQASIFLGILVSVAVRFSKICV